MSVIQYTACPNCGCQKADGFSCSVCKYYSSSEAVTCRRCGEQKAHDQPCRNCNKSKEFSDAPGSQQASRWNKVAQRNGVEAFDLGGEAG